MQHENENGIRLNAAGNPDVDYYENKAHSMRNEAIGTGLRAAKNWIYGTLKRTRSSQEGQKGARPQAVQSGWPWVDLILEKNPMRKAITSERPHRPAKA